MFEHEIKLALKKATKLKEIQLEIPSNPEFGDFAFPCFMLSKEQKKSPVEIAKSLEILIKPHNTIKKVKAMGPYLNIFINKQVIAQNILPEIFQKQDKFGHNKSQQNKIVIEYPGPNTNKPLHLGHVRNMCLGQSLSNLLKSQGNTIIPVNINNDRGIHICKSMLAYQKYGKDDSPEKSNLKSDFFVGKYYVLFNKKVKENPQLEQEANDLLQKWEQGDKETIFLWKKMNQWAFSGFKKTYKTFNIQFKKEYYESEIYKKGKEIVKEGLKNNIFQKEEDDSIFIDLTKQGFDKKTLLRSNGTSVYITQDIYLAKKRYEDFKFDKLIYIVANEQIYHFKVLFEIFKKLKYSFANQCKHFSYGMVNLTSGKMKSREGNVIDADTLVNDLTEMAKKEITKRFPQITKLDLEKRSNKISMSAVKFYILNHDPLKDFTFDSKKSISFEGETGPYIQYTFARINSIIKKSKEKIISQIDFNLLNSKDEENLIKKLSTYPETLKISSEKYKISLLTHYLLDLAQEFNSYYHHTPVIQENKKLEQARLLLLYDLQQVLKSGLNILGIETMGEM